LFYGGGLTTDYTTTRLKPLALPRVFLGAERRAVAEVEAEISPCTSSQRFPLAKGST
jgi:hypothetical protein